MTTATMPASEQLDETKIETYRDLVIAIADGKPVSDETLFRLMAGRTSEHLQADVELLFKRREAATSMAEAEQYRESLIAAKLAAEEQYAKRVREHRAEQAELLAAIERAAKAAVAQRSTFNELYTRSHSLLEITADPAAAEDAYGLSGVLVRAQDAARQEALNPVEKLALSNAKRELQSLERDLNREHAAGNNGRSAALTVQAAALTVQAAAVRAVISRFENRLQEHRRLCESIPQLEQQYEAAKRRRFLPENLKLSEPSDKTPKQLAEERA